jgi:hypothetical protein
LFTVDHLRDLGRRVSRIIIGLKRKDIQMVTKTEAFPSRWLYAADLPEQGQVLKVAKLEFEKVGQEQKVKPVLYFRGHDKQLGLNVTNWDLIAAFCGADSDTWTGKDVVLYPTTTTFGSKTVDCIRVRRPRSQQTPVKAAQPKTLVPLQNEDGDPGYSAEDAIDFRV